MKKTIFVLLLFVCRFSFAQSDTIVIQTGPAAKRELKQVLIINGFLISDTAKANFFLNNFADIITKRKIYSSTKGYKRWGIASQDGILFCRTKRNVIIDIASMKEIKMKN